MKFRYEENLIAKVKKRMSLRGLALLVLSASFLCSFFLSVPWYASLLPSFIALSLTIGDLSGTRKMEKYRRSMEISVDDTGLSIQVHGLEKPIFWAWEKIGINRVKEKNGLLSSFVIDTGDEYAKQWEFTNDIENFSSLYERICHHSNT